MSPFFNHVVTIEQPTAAQDAQGSQAVTWSTRYANVRGALQPARAWTITEYAKRAVRISHTWFQAAANKPEHGDRLKIGTRLFYVRGIIDVIEAGSLLRVDCEELPCR